ncbi:MaoC/PaaZ C-terminal domain-containing protein [Rouxiella chamberiensis]|uniref:MaoC/PaaZ C-terminal domain-containing protein n=1 Tax=Rouxiella chamberiensis TaxID=1513468 RepID=A0ABY7HUQ4_9GAMM|nr:MaoC/PaaZ C-terminal domain-containing protein [Rouxiella chamberiensis]WAT02506.1 MaoC/PaaZ C-terminal domain-containing protein [Rouxiella chamberiensis]
MYEENAANDYLHGAEEYAAPQTLSESSPAALHLDGLAVGQIFHSPEYYVSAQEITEFSSKYDPQPFHMDDELAKDSIFRGLAASGWHTVSITMNLLVKSLPLAQGIIGTGVEKINWLRPTRPGDILRIQARITEISSSPARPDRAKVSIQIGTFGQDNKLRQELIGKLLIFRAGKPVDTL